MADKNIHSIWGEKKGHPGGLAQIVLFIIINSNVILKPPVTSSQQHLISEVIH